MRASVRRHLVIDAPADDVWAVAGRAQLLHHWFPGVVACEMTGAVRTVTLNTGLSLDEEIITCDPIQRRLQYRISGRPFAEHLASLDVLPLADGTSLVVYATDADPATMAVVMGGAMGGALDELRRQVEAGAGPAVDAAASAPPPEVIGGPTTGAPPDDPDTTNDADTPDDPGTPAPEGPR